MKNQKNNQSIEYRFDYKWWQKLQYNKIRA